MIVTNNSMYLQRQTTVSAEYQCPLYRRAMNTLQKPRKTKIMRATTSAEATKLKYLRPS
jgi:hypothetical protein